jgi:L-cysteine S-thiosulfotransferase
MKIRLISTAACVAALLGAFAAPAVQAASQAEMIAKGKQIAFHRQLGNCLTCHVMADGEAAGNIGPALVQMKVRFPDKNALRAQIWDSTVKNPQTMMPPFGRHNILTEEQIDAVVEFVYSL